MCFANMFFDLLHCLVNDAAFLPCALIDCCVCLWQRKNKDANIWLISMPIEQSICLFFSVWGLRFLMYIRFSWHSTFRIINNSRKRAKRNGKASSNWFSDYLNRKIGSYSTQFMTITAKNAAKTMDDSGIVRDGAKLIQLLNAKSNSSILTSFALVVAATTSFVR